jgi:transcriptional regulator with XRE-family HTH domain
MVERRKRIVTHITVEKEVCTVGPVGVAFAKAVRTLREQNGQTQEDIAAAVGLGRTSVVNIEAARQRVLLEDVWLWAAALRVSPSGLFRLVAAELAE